MELTQKTIDTVSSYLGGILFSKFGLFINDEEKVKDEDYDLYEAFKEIDNNTVTWSEMAYVLSMLVSNRFEHTEEKVNIKFTEAWNV